MSDKPIHLLYRWGGPKCGWAVWNRYKTEQSAFQGLKDLKRNDPHFINFWGHLKIRDNISGWESIVS